MKIKLLEALLVEVTSMCRLRRMLSVSLVLFMVASCGQSDSTGKSNLAAGMRYGSVSLILTDAPSAEFSAVNFTFTKIEFLGDEIAPVTVYEGEQSVNLLSLTNFGQLLSVVEHIPAGTYSKIRLTLKKPDGIELIPLGGGDPIYPALTGNGKMDLLPRQPFSVIADEMLYLQLDIDAEKSLHIVEKGNPSAVISAAGMTSTSKTAVEYVVRPVVFIDFLTDLQHGKLLRVTGYAHSEPADTESFVLCSFAPAEEPAPDAIGDPRCMEVSTRSASIFDTTGEPVDPSAVHQGDPITLVGFINTSHVASSGLPLIGINAEVIELGASGTYFILNAVIDTAPLSENGTFTFDTSAATNIPGQLQAGSKVFRRDGERLDYTAIQPGVQAGLDGTPASTDPAVMKTTLVVIDHQPDALTDSVTGSLQSINLAENTLMVNDVMILVSADTQVMQSGTMADSMMSEVLMLDQLMEGDALTVYGHYNSESQLLADVILKTI